ncbi:hypothetical protein EBB07_06510 [Paenibacillaceae bacterium]|nr:hypothetical protein EBB07_06510 [Paenibacillaceae bacterium]
MLQKLQQWNRKSVKWLWVLVIIGIIAAVPLGASRVQMEKSAKQIEFVYNYRALLQIASYQADPQQFVDEHLVKMREAGIGTMSIFEGSFDELIWSGRLTMYNSSQAALLQGKAATLNENYTYVLFADQQAADVWQPMIEETFARYDIPAEPWTFEDRPGMMLRTPIENAMVKPLPFDPMTIAKLKQAGFHLLPRLSDRVQPYKAEEAEALLQQFVELGVTRILFDGVAVKGFADSENEVAESGEVLSATAVGETEAEGAPQQNLRSFGQLLKQHGIGIVAIENLKVPQKGFNTIAALTEYNVTRVYSLSETDAMRLSPSVIADRFLLAAKDRNMRMFYLNGAPVRSVDKAAIIHSLDNIYDSLQGDKDGETEGAIALLKSFGFDTGVAKAFDYKQPSWTKPLKAIIVLGAVAIIALLIGVFIPLLLLPSFVIGLVGSAGLFVLSSSALEQGLALGATIASPTLALIWVTKRIRLHTDGDRRTIGGQWDAPPERSKGWQGVIDMFGLSGSGLFGGRWVFPGMSAGRRLVMAVVLYVLTAILTLVSVPLMVGLLNNITYSLVIQQFRGVALLHLAPIALTAVYLFIYTGNSVKENLRKLLSLQITLFWVIAAAVLGVAGMYYLSRTGNAGSVSAIEMIFRNLLETTIGVRPRFKEFLFAHPLFLLGIFLSLRYRAAWILIIVASIGQLSLVDTFAHIHTPLYISSLRVVLGLVLGAIIGVVLIGVWQLAEGVWRKWAVQRGKNNKATV